MEKFLVLLVVIVIAGCCLPIWRIAGGKQGLTAWQYWNKTRARSHIPASEAKYLALEAYQDRGM